MNNWKKIHLYTNYSKVRAELHNTFYIYIFIHVFVTTGWKKQNQLINLEPQCRIWLYNSVVCCLALIFFVRAFDSPQTQLFSSLWPQINTVLMCNHAGRNIPDTFSSLCVRQQSCSHLFTRLSDALPVAGAESGWAQSFRLASNQWWCHQNSTSRQEKKKIKEPADCTKKKTRKTGDFSDHGREEAAVVHHPYGFTCCGICTDGHRGLSGVPSDRLWLLFGNDSYLHHDCLWFPDYDYWGLLEPLPQHEKQGVPEETSWAANSNLHSWQVNNCYSLKTFIGKEWFKFLWKSVFKNT